MNNKKYYDHCHTQEWYDSKQDFYNSPLLDDDIVFNYIYQGKRQPQNDKEKRWAEEAEKMSKSGKGYDMSFG